MWVFPLRDETERLDCIGHHPLVRDVSRLVPARAEDLAGTLGVGLPAHADGEPLEELREVAVGLGPGDVHLFDPMVVSLHPGHHGVDPGRQLHRGQVAPFPLLLGIVEGELLPALGTGEGHPIGVLLPDVDPLLLDVSVNSEDRRGRFHTEDPSEESGILHAVHSRARPPTMSRRYPPVTPKSRKVVERSRIRCN